MKAQSYKLNPAHYQNATQKTPEQTNLNEIIKRMFDAKYTENEIREVMGMAAHDDVLVARLFMEAEAENQFDRYKTSVNLLMHKLRLYRDKPVPDQPPTLEELENRQEADPLLYVTENDTLDHYWFSGRVQGFTSIEYFRWIKQHSRDVLLEALHEIVYQQPVSVADFDQRLNFHFHSVNGKV